jgi:hypothetical protein
VTRLCKQLFVLFPLHDTLYRVPAGHGRPKWACNLTSAHQTRTRTRLPYLVFLVLRTVHLARYTLYFATNLACAVASRPPVPSYGPHNHVLSDKLSGGWIFVILAVVAAVVYVIGGMAYVRHKTHQWGFPNAVFWDNFGTYVNDGITVVISCGRQKVGGDAGYAAHASSPYDSVPPTTSAPASSGGYGGSYHSSGPAYTDI